MALSAKLLPRGQAARLDLYAHSSRLLKGGVPGDFAHTVHSTGENRFAHYGPPLELSIYIDENESNT